MYSTEYMIVQVLRWHLIRELCFYLAIPLNVYFILLSYLVMQCEHIWATGIM